MQRYVMVELSDYSRFINLYAAKKFQVTKTGEIILISGDFAMEYSF